MTAPTRSCGSCGLCCKIMRVDELQKPTGQWCAHFKSGVGCSIHGSHPQSCRNFQCMWILSPTMPDAVRPDRVKVMFQIDDGDRRIIARADPADPGAWRREPIYGQLKRWATDYWFKGRTIWAMVGNRMWLIAPNQDVDLGDVDERSPIGYEEAPDGTITVKVFMPLPDGEEYDASAPRAELRQVVQRPPSALGQGRYPQ